MIYLDHAAATPLSQHALQAMLPYFSERFFNPSAAYLPAHRVREDYIAAKTVIASFIGAKPTDLVITSGATEANTLALSVSRGKGKILALATEHASILNALGSRPHSLIKVRPGTGLIDLTDFQQQLTSDVSLVSVSLVNNELGTIQPLSEIAQLIRQERLNRAQAHNPLPLYLHSDASQGLGLLDISVSRLGVDLLTLNSAKISGPKGVGALYFSRSVKLLPLFRGGGQESGLRSGTENVPGAIGFAAALADLKGKTVANRKKYTRLTQLLRAELEKASVQPLFLADSAPKLANFLPVSFPGLDAERLIYKCEEQEVYFSTGAACAASKGEPSRVLTAIGLSPVEIAGSLRLSLGVTNTEENVRRAGQIIRAAVDAETSRLAASAPATTMPPSQTHSPEEPEERSEA